MRESSLFTVLLIIVLAGVLAGLAGYLSDAVSSVKGTSEVKRRAFRQYIVFGLIASGCVPLFLSLAQSQLLPKILESPGWNTIPYYECFIVLGICFIASLSARKFLDSISQQVLRNVDEIRDRTESVAKTAQEAQTKAVRAEEKADVAAELVDEKIAESEPVGGHGGEQDVELTEPDTAISELDPREQAVLKNMMHVTFRTTTGIARDSGIQRSEIGEILDRLITKDLVGRTISPNTKGPRWRITPRGVRSLNSLENRTELRR
jgi:DNA-binding MarR family transcriptional regulator